MIADPRADEVGRNFAGQWLYLRNLEANVPVQAIFPNFDDTLREGLRRETELFFSSIVREDRNVLDLLDADYTYVNDRVAQHYGIPNVQGNHFRRVQLPPDSPRRGLLGKGSLLVVTSQPDRTSPVLRGKWVLQNLLGPSRPRRPPTCRRSTQQGHLGGKLLSMRQRLEKHRSNPACASCHTMMDSLGFALEASTASAVTARSTRSATRSTRPVCCPTAAGSVGWNSSRAALMSSDLFQQTLTEKLMVYALGRGIEPNDMPAVRRIVRDAAAKENGSRSTSSAS
jgi:hypothetical protein